MWNQGAVLDGRYLLRARVGAGSMGDVWRARDEVLDREVAVKILLPTLLDDPRFAERFRTEARILASLKHPGIVVVHDYGENPDPRAAYLVMELLTGQPLHQVMAEAEILPPARTLSILAQTLDALQAAHDRGVVHRDVKPANLVLDADDRLTVTDFGVAHSMASGRITGRDMLLGTALYSAPEQMGTGALTPAVDQYAAGVIAYECLTGLPPFYEDDVLGTIAAHLSAPVPDLPDELPTPVRELVLRALSKDPAHRFPDAAAMASAARAALAELGPEASAVTLSRQDPEAVPQALPGVRDGAPGDPVPEATHPPARSAAGQDARGSVPPPGAVPVAPHGSRRRRVALWTGAAGAAGLGIALVAAAGGVGLRHHPSAQTPPGRLAPSVTTSTTPSGSPSPGASGPRRTTQDAPPAPSASSVSSKPAGSSRDTATDGTADASNPLHSPDSPAEVSADRPPGPTTVRGQVTCISGQAVVGVWLRSDSVKEFAQWKRVGEASAAYWYTLPGPESYHLKVGCGGSPQDWGRSLRSAVVSGTQNSFTCDDVRGSADKVSCVRVGG
ncbi:protein kinase [Streptomyces cyaneofuscatus]|uniref:serine/threonine-protein kinase n=1 Tax=Streptomyces cyaneofuscatus TaxID=66883 RepID=UPI0038129A78